MMIAEQKTILVTGVNGQLGQSLMLISVKYPQYQFSFTGRDDLDLSRTDSITDYFQQNRFDYIINCAAYTAVDNAESEPELADKINHIAVKKLAEVAKEHEATLVHISTDYVFDGTSHRPYIETDNTNPQSVYGASKLKGEKAIQEIKPKGCIIRTSWVYSEFGNNFVRTMLELGQDREQLSVIFDQVGSPTYAKDLAQAIMTIVQSNQLNDSSETEIYNYSNEGVCSWYDFARTIFEIKGITCAVSAIETKDYPTAATRPHYSVLNKAKIKQVFNIAIPYWKVSLAECIGNIEG